MLNNQKEITLLQDLGYLYPTNTSKRKAKYSLFKCYCGKKFKAQTIDIKSGHTKSCGCLKKDRFVQYNKDTKITHKLSGNRLYKTWLNMMARCYNPKHKSFKDYGVRGITVCEEWHNVENFINDMFPTYIEGLKIDRIDNNKNYSKENCRWASQNIQSRNTRKLMSTNTSGYRGVYCIKKDNKWKSQIGLNNKTIHLGRFNTALEAAKAYDNYIINNNLEHTRNF